MLLCSLLFRMAQLVKKVSVSNCKWAFFYGVRVQGWNPVIKKKSNSSKMCHVKQYICVCVCNIFNHVFSCSWRKKKKISIEHIQLCSKFPSSILIKSALEGLRHSRHSRSVAANYIIWAWRFFNCHLFSVENSLLFHLNNTKPVIACLIVLLGRGDQHSILLHTGHCLLKLQKQFCKH